MPAPLVVVLTTAQRAELLAARDHDPRPYVRERASGVLKVADGASVRQVAHTGLLRWRRPETVRAWIGRYQQAGLAGFDVAPGRGRKPVHFPPQSGDRGAAGAGGAPARSRAPRVSPKPVDAALAGGGGELVP